MELKQYWLAIAALPLAGCGPFQPTPADKDVCLDVDDLIERGVDAEVNRPGERWLGIRNFGASQLMYDYNQPRKRDSQQILFIQCQVLKQRTSFEAMVTYRTQVLTAKAIAIGGLQDRKRTEGNCEGADACVLIDFLAKEQPVGNHFVVRSGARVISVSLLGVHFDDVNDWHELVAEKVAAIEKLE